MLCIYGIVLITITCADYKICYSNDNVVYCVLNDRCRYWTLSFNSITLCYMLLKTMMSWQHKFRNTKLTYT